MLARLSAEHGGPCYFYYLDASFDETLRRHATRPQQTEFGADQMRSWYKARDLLTAIPERVMPESSTLPETAAVILAESQLLTSIRLRAEAAAPSDMPSWLELAAEVEPLFGPMPNFAEHAHRAVARNSALVVRDPGDRVLGAALLAHKPHDRTIHWLAVRSDARRRGVGRILVAEILRRWPPPGDIEVVTFGPDVAGCHPARALYESAGFSPADTEPSGPEGGTRQRFILRQSGSPLERPTAGRACRPSQ